jgi:hypothetical protein
MWHEPSWIEPTDELVHPALRMNLRDLANAGRGRSIKRHGFNVLPAYRCHSFPNVVEIGIGGGIIARPQ